MKLSREVTHLSCGTDGPRGGSAAGLSQGWSDAKIAEHLVISLRTVNCHTTSLYSKLGVSSRAAVARSALEHHLL